MPHKRLLDRIVLNPKVMTGKPVIKGTRLTVQFILGLLAGGATVEDVLAEYKDLERADIKACLLYASEMLEETQIVPQRA